nr:uncharacterized protein LOC120822877 isoform X1 [Gasterosteus aculeatus aculeatus]XP_040038768.1 uncharacterized protein LOC120822877 isoform X1 [Gasterosteus aculeatus aculeatus]XP_040038769.1 uncharacterized protein LOC120822877 isoform X1 [Gasterosteus aculeatus aculeatus]XP_040038770.1 uncharacterized protein LOC120822877 isoform X1 [Gasterosteus aculeatus aculeatus]XP_040038771.1 uncharacterized protein LOC120822877 isoform X1 [Gasterosteus aculeatus aculeatus]
MANKTKIQASGQTSSDEEPLNPNGHRPSQKAKRRGPAEKQRRLRDKRRGNKEKKQEGVTVKRMYSDGKRRWDKKHYCVFCRQPQVKIARHLLTKHGDQQEVAAAGKLPTGSKQRHFLLEHLRCRGNYMHNIEVIRQGTGEIVPWRQPSEDVDARNYLPCPLCLGFFLRADLWKHQASCRKKMTSEPPKEFTTKFTSDLTKDTNSDSAGKSACNPTADRSDASTEDAPSDPSGDTTTKGQTSDPTVNQNETSHPEADQPRKRNRVQAAASRLLPISSGASESCSEVLHRMNQDHVSHQVKSDWLICKYGNKLMGNQDGSQRRYDYVSQKLRELGRFLLAAKSLDSGVQNLQDLLAPGRLALSLSAARKAAGYRWSRPPLAVKTTLKTLCEIAIGETLQDGDVEAAAKTTDFYHVLGREWDQLGLQSPDSNTDEAVRAKLKKRLVPSRGGKCKDPADLRPEVLSPSRPRTSTYMSSRESRLQTPAVPVAPGKVQRRPWSSAEKEAVWRQLGVYVLVQSVPGKEVCQRCLDLEPDLRGRHWKDVKNQVHNQIQSQKKQQFHTQMDLQENQGEQSQNQNKQQQYQDHTNNPKKQQQYQGQFDNQDHLQTHKKQLHHMGEQTDLDRDTSVLTVVAYGPDGPHRGLLDPPVSPYLQLLDGSVQYHTVSRHTDQNMLQEVPPGQPHNAHSGLVYF